jgi:hypothetical protein
MSNIISQSPQSFNNLLDNLFKVVVNPQLELDDDLAVIEPGVFSLPEKRNFCTLIEHVDSLFWQLLGNEKLNCKALEYLPGRLFIRLERIAAKKSGISLEEAHEMMRPFGDKILARLKEDLPAAVIVEKDQVFQETAAPFFQERQAKIYSCQAHAINNYFGKPIIAVSDCEQSHPAVDADKEGFSLQRVHQVSHRNFIAHPYEKILEDPSIDRFFSQNNVHAFTYRKDPQWHWWKVDSLYKVNDRAYQIPVDLSCEKNSWANGAIYLSLSQGELIEYLSNQLQLSLNNIGESKIELQKAVQSPETMNQLEDLLQKCLLHFVICPCFQLQEYFIEDPSALSFFKEVQKDYKDAWNQTKVSFRAVANHAEREEILQKMETTFDKLNSLCLKYKNNLISQK